MIQIREIRDPSERAKICDEILRALPDWFGIESAILDYVAQVKTMAFYPAFDEERAVGFVAVKRHNLHTAEVCVMGVLEAYHRQGIGKRLIAACEVHCRENHLEFLTVKTVDDSSGCDRYAKTRAFYFSAGFRPLEVFPLFWDERNPCLFMVKCV